MTHNLRLHLTQTLYRLVGLVVEKLSLLDVDEVRHKYLRPCI